MPEAIAGYRYDLADPPDCASAWVEELCGQAAALKEQLQAAQDVNQGLKVKVRLPLMQGRFEAQLSSIFHAAYNTCHDGQA